MTITCSPASWLLVYTYLVLIGNIHPGPHPSFPTFPHNVLNVKTVQWEILMSDKLGQFSKHLHIQKMTTMLLIGVVNMLCIFKTINFKPTSRPSLLFHQIFSCQNYPLKGIYMCTCRSVSTPFLISAHLVINEHSFTR